MTNVNIGRMIMVTNVKIGRMINGRKYRMADGMGGKCNRRRVVRVPDRNKPRMTDDRVGGVGVTNGKLSRPTAG